MSSSSSAARLSLLVTGAAGFIGRAVVAAALARGHRVTGVVRRAAAPLPAGAETAVADLAQPGALTPFLRGVDAVVHCAASLSGDASSQRCDTVEGTRHVVQAMGEVGVSRFVLLSSCAVYDVAALAPGAVLDERAPLAGDAAVRGPYIEAKLAQEALAREDSRNLDWRIVRPGLVFGPGRTWFYDLGLHLHPRLWVALAGTAELPLTYVDNCADAVVRAAEVSGGRFVVNVVDDERPTRSAYLRALARRAQPTPVVLDLPWGVAKAASQLANLVGVEAGMLHPARLAARCQPQRYSNLDAKTHLGWRPSVSMDEALARSLFPGR